MRNSPNSDIFGSTITADRLIGVKSHWGGGFKDNEPHVSTVMPFMEMGHSGKRSQLVALETLKLSQHLSLGNFNVKMLERFPVGPST